MAIASPQPDSTAADLSALNLELQQKIAERDHVSTALHTAQESQKILDRQIGALRDRMYELEHESVARGSNSIGVPLRLTHPGASLDALGLKSDHAALLGYKGLGFRMIDQFRGAEYTSNFIFGQLVDLIQRISGKDRNPEQVRSFALEVMQDLQQRLREKGIDLDLV